MECCKELEAGPTKLEKLNIFLMKTMNFKALFIAAAAIMLLSVSI
jgi:hypothetical protein